MAELRDLSKGIWEQAWLYAKEPLVCGVIKSRPFALKDVKRRLRVIEHHTECHDLFEGVVPQTEATAVLELKGGRIALIHYKDSMDFVNDCYCDTSGGVAVIGRNIDDIKKKLSENRWGSLAAIL